MEWLGFFMLGGLAGFLTMAAVAVSCDRDAARERVFKCDGKLYKLTPIDPDELTS